MKAQEEVVRVMEVAVTAMEAVVTAVVKDMHQPRRTKCRQAS